MLGMAGERRPRWVLARDLRPRKALATCLIVAILTPACATSRSGSAPPEVATGPSREECEEFAQKAKAAVQGSSGFGPGRMHIGPGNQPQNARSGADAVAGLAAYAALFAVAGLIAGTAAAVKNERTREAAYSDAMAACLRPGILARELGPEHPEVARSLHTLGYLYVRQAEPEKAEPLFARALAIREQRADVDPVQMAGILDDYAALLRQTGRAGEAAELERRAQEVRRAKP
jgi:hypothetical protein